MTNGISSINQNINTLDVYIGGQKKVATITLPVGSETEIAFTYEPRWIADGFAISPHLPLTGDFEHKAVRNFLQNLLPEGQGFKELTSNTTISKNNTFGLIKAIGAETSGALSFKTEVSNTDSNSIGSSFREVTEQELNDKLTRFKSHGESITFWDGKTRISVAGVQDKLTLLEIDGKLGFGEGDLCSNKIVKFETGKAPFIAVNELFTMLLAGQAGLSVPYVELRRYGGVRAYVIDRFDRRLTPDKSKVLRRHMIDGCQATNLPPSYKYERQHGDEGDGIYIRDGVSFAKLFALNTVNNEAYHSQLIRWMTFNILARNYDAHGKNISFFVGKKGLELTPFYDLVNVEAIIREIQQQQVEDAPSRANSISQYYAMSIGSYEMGSAGNFNNPITAYMLADFANEFGISRPRLQLIMGQTITSVINGLESAKQQALQQGLSNSEIQHIDLCTSIINEAAMELRQEIEQLPAMGDLV
ncbi:HipA domain-containing protein [Psychrosphaera sp. 1_MG-2023]|uniref:HipA domain-containing protein n=1 Tax=Psychrosphaera sp. 1_MG-2023 TaxID=3062643 RepID=UPI0026E116A1|nr:HipA domain-containing protein [Psychrosphaera sp. 1_MG-2023]MDO6721042.1 HipA domain-containing protein [Psychrosphaera sp. 1_MG-2023]